MKKCKSSTIDELIDSYWKHYDASFERYKSCLKNKRNLRFDIVHNKVYKVHKNQFIPRGKAYQRIAEREVFK